MGRRETGNGRYVSECGEVWVCVVGARLCLSSDGSIYHVVSHVGCTTVRLLTGARHHVVYSKKRTVISETDHLTV